MANNSTSIGSRNHRSTLVDTSHTSYRGVNNTSSLLELSLGSSNSSSMCSLGSLHFSSVNRDHTNIGVANNSTSIDSRNHRNTNGMFDVSSSLVEVCLGSSNSRGVFRDHSTIRVSHHGSRHSHRARINSLG